MIDAGVVVVRIFSDESVLDVLHREFLRGFSRLSGFHDSWNEISIDFQIVLVGESLRESIVLTNGIE